MEKLPKPKAVQEEERNYFSMSYEQVQGLSQEELAQAATESEISVERLLETMKEAPSPGFSDSFSRITGSVK